MKEKIIVGIIVIIVFIGAIFTAVLIKKEQNQNKNNKLSSVENEAVTDECTEEYELLAKSGENVKPVNSSDEKVSSNSVLILKKYYKECKHTINEYVETPPELVNMTQEEVKNEYPEWELIGFSSREVTLYKEFEGSCGEHFSLKEEDGKVVIYKVLADGTEKLYEKTEIITEYLPLTDLLQIQSEKGIQVFGKEELNKVLEDFE